MPLFARLDRTDTEAMYRYLRSVPKVRRPNQPGGHPLRKATPNDSPEQLFVNVGCAACHGQNGPYRDKIRGVASKSEAEIAAWILDPQAFKPGSIMPSFEHEAYELQGDVGNVVFPCGTGLLRAATLRSVYRKG